MANFENVKITIEGNSYFDGKVTSRKLEFSDGTIKTLGVMQIGEYEFGTDAPELMEITSGEAQINLDGDSWITVKSGESFNVDGNSKFKIKANTLVDYCCSYL